MNTEVQSSHYLHTPELAGSLQRLRIARVFPHKKPPSHMCRKRAHLDAPLAFSSAGRLAETVCQGKLASDGHGEGAAAQSESQSLPDPSRLWEKVSRQAHTAAHTLSLRAGDLSLFP